MTGMSAMSLNGSRRDGATSGSGDGIESGRINDKYNGGEKEKKKKHHFFGSKR